MKGKGTIFVAVAALIGGAALVILLSNANTTISEHVATITQNEEKIKGLEEEKNALETTKVDLNQKLSTANSTITQAKTQLADLNNQYSLKVAEYETFVSKAAQEIADKDEKITALNGELNTAQNKNRGYDSRNHDKCS